MKILKAYITEIFICDSKYISRVEFFKMFNDSFVEISDEKLIFKPKSAIYQFPLQFESEDFITKTYHSEYEDGSPFRVLVRSNIAQQIHDLKHNRANDISISVGSLNPDGYAVFFELIAEGNYKKIAIQYKNVDDQIKNMISISLIEAKANILKRLVLLLQKNSKNLREYNNGTDILKLLKANIHIFNEYEKGYINSL